MRIFLTGVGCVGKTTVGVRLAELMGLRFFDLDAETEQFFGMPIQRLRHLQEIKKDVTYFKKSYARADLQVSIEDMDVEQAAQHLLAQLKAHGP